MCFVPSVGDGTHDTNRDRRRFAGLVSMEDLIARLARLNWNLIEGKAVDTKFVRDFLRLAEGVSSDEVEWVWQEHRQPQSPKVC